MKKLILITLTCAYIYAHSNTTEQKYTIQLGVFTHEENINKLKKRYKNFDIFVKKYPNKIKKLFIVNIKDKDLEKTLAFVKKDIPKAFVVKKKQSNWMQEKLSKNTNSSNNSKLDSKAFIKTRNKFFE